MKVTTQINFGPFLAIPRTDHDAPTISRALYGIVERVGIAGQLVDEIGSVGGDALYLSYLRDYGCCAEGMGAMVPGSFPFYSDERSQWILGQ